MLSSNNEILKINNLQISYPNSSSWIIHGLSLQIRKGERLALIGSSGCGKSTVAKAVLQLLPARSICQGDIYVDGKDVLTADQATLKRIRGEVVGFVFQDPMTRLNPLMTIGEHLVDTLWAHRPWDKFVWCKKRI